MIKNDICGTSAGLWAHRKLHEVPCDICKMYWAEYQKTWRQKNKQKAKAYVTKWRLNNLERHKTIKNNWAAKNRDSYKKSITKVRKNNPKKYAEISRNKTRRRRVKIKLQQNVSYSEQQVLDMYGNLCHLCAIAIDLQATRKCGTKGWEYGLHIDHVIPISMGGQDNLENVRPSHAICNLRKGAKIA